MDMICVYSGKEITVIREALGKKPTEFAVLLGVSESAVNRWENDNRSPKLDTMRILNEIVDKAKQRGVVFDFTGCGNGKNGHKNGKRRVPA